MAWNKHTRIYLLRAESSSVADIIESDGNIKTGRK